MFGAGSSSRKRSRSPSGRSYISSRPGTEGVFMRDPPSSSHHRPSMSGRTKSEPEGYFVRRRNSSRSRSRSPPGGLSGFLGVGGGSSSKHRSKSPGGLGGLFGGGGNSRHGASHSRSRARSPNMLGGLGSFFGGGGRHSSSYDRNRSPQSDIRSFFGGGGRHYSSTSRYGRQPRQGLVQKIMTAIRRTLRDLVRYARNNPVKMVTLVLMPLLTSGILVKLLGGLGIKLPASLGGLAGGAGAGAGGRPGQPMGGGYYGSQGYGGPPGPAPPAQGGGGMLGGIGLSEVMNVAKMFM